MLARNLQNFMEQLSILINNYLKHFLFKFRKFCTPCLVAGGELEVSGSHCHSKLHNFHNFDQHCF